MNVGIVGFGYWGKNLVRNFFAFEGCTLQVVCEQNTALHSQLAAQYPSVSITSDFNDLLKHDSIDCIVIATPVSTHYELTKLALQAGKHVLVEKPMTAAFNQAKELTQLAEKEQKVLMVDHTFLYTGAVRYIKQLIKQGGLGKINYIDSTRINLGLFQQDVNVLWDLAAHDLSICAYLLEKRPRSVQAIGVSHTDNAIENIAYLILKYDNNLIAHFNCSWVSPVKIRQMLIGGDKKMIVYNDTEPTEKVKIYDTGYEAKTDEERANLLVDYRTGDIQVPKVPMTEALSLLVQDFADAVKKGKKPDSDAQLGLEVVQILDAAQESIKHNSKVVCLQ
ncbi:MAG: oxidoreductase [Flavobacteriales bacterium]|nr:MAG: oxidoreductase [Flavobacteriales bacterium]